MGRQSQPESAAGIAGAFEYVAGQVRQSLLERDLYSKVDTHGKVEGPHFSCIFPLTLLRSASVRRASSPNDNAQLVGTIVAYVVDSRATFLNQSPAEVMDSLRLRLPIDNYDVIVREAHKLVDDYAADWSEHSQRKVPQVRVHYRLLMDAYNGDLSLRDFLVYCAIVSCMDMRRGSKNLRRPTRMSVSHIQRWMHGFHHGKVFNAAVASQTFTVTYSKDQIRRAVKQLVKSGLLFKATRKSETYYATRAVLQEAQIRNLHAWVRGKQERSNTNLRRTQELDRLYEAPEYRPTEAPQPQTEQMRYSDLDVATVLKSVGLSVDPDQVTYVPHLSTKYAPGSPIECSSCGKVHPADQQCNLADLEAAAKE